MGVAINSTSSKKNKKNVGTTHAHIVLVPTSVSPRSKAAVDLVQNYVMGGCKVMDLLQENWGVGHMHDSEKRKEDLCVQSIWVRLE